MGERIRDWVVAVSLAAALGVLVGGVYSGVTGWQGPAGGIAGASTTTRTTASAGSGLPTPNERPSPTASRRPAPTVRTAQVLTVHQPDSGGPAKVAEAAQDDADEDGDCPDAVRDGGKPDGERGEQSEGEQGAQPTGGHGEPPHKHDQQGNC